MAARIDPEAIIPLRDALPVVGRVVTSPALRCRQTADALWPDHDQTHDPRLWEQDFGAHDGLPHDRLPDLGPMDARTLSDWTPPGGESFSDLCARVAPALSEHALTACGLGRPLALVVHAGVVRAAVAQVTGTVHAGLAFEVANLSVTRLRCGADGPFSVIEVNRECPRRS
ncbi:histidine phosphatase family protein [Maritimibacter sp. 55A14]|uniref:histidine phosphatase family protein n=1 Tax=Maritimibacter sp. 55A14 TaxID=2174844 RepID=UPI001E39AD95|nr:histidine phosphatase family protein [Maritimibacter sp. 55A14]